MFERPLDSDAKVGPCRSVVREREKPHTRIDQPSARWPVAPALRRIGASAAEVLLPIQQQRGNRYVQKVLPQVCPTPPTLVEQADKESAEAAEGLALDRAPESAGLIDMPMNDSGLLDGDLQSDVVPHLFVSLGKTGAAIIHWAGGGGGRGNESTGSITVIAPQIDSAGPAAAGGSGTAWVRAGTGTATVTRSYTGALVGANGPNYYITARAATRIDAHEQAHVNSSSALHNTHITPLEVRVAARTGQPNALSTGTTAAQASAALQTFLNWNASILAFTNADIAANTPMGTVDMADRASPTYVREYGPRAVAGVNYLHYIDTPPGP
jgi:hypothetical protein